MNAETKIAHQRLSLLELAQNLGNVAEAGRTSNIRIVCRCFLRGFLSASTRPLGLGQ